MIYQGWGGGGTVVHLLLLKFSMLKALREHGSLARVIVPHNASQSNVCKFVALNSLRIGQGEEYFKSPLEKKETKRPQKKQRPIMTYLRLVQACVICCKKTQ